MGTRASSGEGFGTYTTGSLTSQTQDANALYPVAAWGDIAFTEAWVQLDNYADNFYFTTGLDSSTARNNFGKSFTQFRPDQTTFSCNYFIGETGQPGSGGTTHATCGSTTDGHATGPVYDVNGGWCWWSYTVHTGGGRCDGGSAGSKARVWVR